MTTYTETRLDEQLRNFVGMLERLKRTELRGEEVTPESLLLQHGRFWPAAPLPRNVKRGVPRACFMNAEHTRERHPSLTYVEGWAVSSAELTFPVHHAWCVDGGGNVVDPTWDPVGVSYFGAPFAPSWIRRVLIDKKVWSGVLYEVSEIQDTPIAQILSKDWR